MHAGLAHGESAPAVPAEHEDLSAAMALTPAFCDAFFPAFLLPAGMFFVCHINLLLLFTKR